MPEHTKPLTKKIRGFVQSENTVPVWSQRIRRNTWPRAKSVPINLRLPILAGCHESTA